MRCDELEMSLESKDLFKKIRVKKEEEKAQWNSVPSLQSLRNLF